MSEPGTETAARPGLYPRVSVAHVGPWWTFDAASISLPARDGHYVSVWSVGTGPSVLFLPPTTDHAFWVPALEDLESSYTVHAMDRRAAPPRSSWELRHEVEVRDALLAAWAVGAEAVVACGESAYFAAAALGHADALRAAVLCVEPGWEEREPDAVAPVARIEIPADAIAESAPRMLGAQIRTTLDRLLISDAPFGEQLG